MMGKSVKTSSFPRYCIIPNLLNLYDSQYYIKTETYFFSNTLNWPGLGKTESRLSLAPIIGFT